MSSDSTPLEVERADTSTDGDVAVGSEPEDSPCPVIDSIEQIGSQWRLAVLHELQKGEYRFNELKRATDANARTLSRVLEDLGELGFVDRRIEEDAPIATYYSLTPKGRSLEPVFDEIECWAGSWLEESTSEDE
ncbi:winged helix-turn-helix transcriptional regulator [Natronosalvus halobius]|uniref:winged helix-turn-helix transcriptional regulator n=1 Tax=Natronosalvus halobius TaxID=2953746 RepID=UPI0020A0212D|nr:helix-turn-helix domain-containing protein [Natronosalvus halobius]USZ72750.1 helix-turn-helix transcriptional regulator [Natronosalvus halobius]